MHRPGISALLALCLSVPRVLANEGSAPSEASLTSQEVDRANNQSLLWGPYRPNLYFGVRPRLPNSLSAGLMWSKVDSYNSVQGSKYFSIGDDVLSSPFGKLFLADKSEDLRSTCEQHQGMTGYGWDEYDIRKGGRETIHDSGNTLDLTIDFVKVPGGQHGGNWAARVKGTLHEDAPEDQITSLYFIASLEGLGSLGVSSESDGHGIQGDVRFTGQTLDLGDFSLDVTNGPETNEHPYYDHPSYEEKPLDRNIVSSSFWDPKVLWQSKCYFPPSILPYLSCFTLANMVLMYSSCPVLSIEARD